MSGPATEPNSTPEGAGSPGIDGEAWSTEPSPDEFEKEASKIFALWELMPPGEAHAPDPTAADAGPETWSADGEAASAAAVAAAPAAAVAVEPATQPAATPAAAPAQSAPVVTSAAATASPVTQTPVTQTWTSAPAASGAVALAPKAVAAEPRPAAGARASTKQARRAGKNEETTGPRAAVHAEEIVLPRRSMAPLAIGGVALLGLMGLGAFVLAGGSGAPASPPLAGAEARPAGTRAPAIATPPAAPVGALAAAPVGALAPIAPAPVVEPAPIAEAVPAAAAPPVVLPPPVVAPPPPPARHTLRVSVTPRSASVTLDGAELRPPYTAELDEGTTHVLVASAEGFDSVTRSVEMTEDQRVRIEMDRTRAIASSVTSAPAGGRSAGRSGTRLGSRIGRAGGSGSGGSSSSGGSGGSGSSGSGTFVSESPY